MAAKQTKKTSRGKKNDDLMTKTSVRVGKALARSAFKAEEAGRKAKETVKEIVDRTASQASKSAKTASKTIKEVADLSKSTDFLKPPKGVSVLGQLDKLAKEICGYLEKNGKTKTEKLVNAMMQQKNSKVAVYGAIGRLAQKGKIEFTTKGSTLSLK